MTNELETARDFHQRPENKSFLVPDAGSDIIIKIGDYPYGSNPDTVTTKYVNIEKGDCTGFVLSADQDISIKKINEKTLHTPRTIATGTFFTKTRGAYYEIVITTTASNTTVEIWCE